MCMLFCSGLCSEGSEGKRGRRERETTTTPRGDGGGAQTMAQGLRGRARGHVTQPTYHNTLYAAGPGLLACQVWVSTQGNMSVYTLLHPVCCRSWTSGMSSLVPRAIYQSTLCHTLYAAGP